MARYQKIGELNASLVTHDASVRPDASRSVEISYQAALK
jgi:hypothetical protein